MKIKRYDMVENFYSLGIEAEMTEQSDGNYVRYEDVEPLLKELEELKRYWAWRRQCRYL